MAEMLVIAWRMKTVHAAASGLYSPTTYARVTLCNEVINVGDWYDAPEGTVVTCIGCIAADPQIQEAQNINAAIANEILRVLKP